jgi:CRISPR/Cas system-associated endoribonuclease Cas2
MKNKSRKIEKKIQERTLRFIYEDYNSSYKCLLEKSKVHSLKSRILKIIAVETLKIIHKIILVIPVVM